MKSFIKLSLFFVVLLLSVSFSYALTGNSLSWINTNSQQVGINQGDSAILSFLSFSVLQEDYPIHVSLSIDDNNGYYDYFDPQSTIDAILGHNLHGVDLDNRAVQIAAASLYIKTQEYLPGYRVTALNIVATDLGLAHIGKNDPAAREFVATLEREAGLKSQVSLQIIEALKGADYLGSLLRIDEEIRAIANAYGERGGTEQMVSSIMGALGAFIRRHDRGEDLGLRSLADQLGKGLRLIEILGRKYDVVVANPRIWGRARSKKSWAHH